MAHGYAVGSRIVVAGTGNFLAADEGIVPGVLNLHLSFPDNCRDNQVVILKQGKAADSLGGLNGQVPQLIRGILGYT